MCYCAEMRKVDYPSLIKESLSELSQHEKTQTTARLRLRVQMLRLLKSGTASEVKQASALVGCSAKHGYDLWHRYRDSGLVKYLTLDYKLKASRLTPSEQQKLLKKAATGFSSQREARAWIAQELGHQYSQQGISWLFQRFKIKAKVARPCNVLQHPEEHTAYKKTLPRS